MIKVNMYVPAERNAPKKHNINSLKSCGGNYSEACKMDMLFPGGKGFQW
jgi:hypothetical protein